MRRECAIVLVVAAPIALAMIVLAARLGGVGVGVAIALVGIVVLAALAWRASRRVEDAWLARRLDAVSPEMDDSAALLFDRVDALTNLQRLQQSRLRARIMDSNADLRTPWPKRAFVTSGAVALLMAVAALTWPAREHGAVAPMTTSPAAHAKDATSITHAELAIDAPPYTKIPPRRENALETKAPEGSRLRWRLRLDPVPGAVSLQFHDSSRIELERDGADWIGERTLAASTLYRIVPDNAPSLAEDRLYRLDAIADQQPEIRVVAPDKTLTLIDARQKTWGLAFEASDDYAIAHADLAVTLAQGSGENIAFKEQAIALDPVPFSPPSPAARDADEGGPPVRVRYAYSLDLAALGLSKGDDVIVKLAVSDNREPKPNITRSASFILRWPADASSETAGLEGIAQKTMPAYFRSQRQIIIDSEALLADKPTLDEAKFLARSDAIGVDQKILRLRYGQFLGEESETHAGHAPPSPHGDHDTGSPHGNPDGETPTQVDALAAAHEAQERQLPTFATSRFGEEGNTLAEYGHVHDIAEAATLLDAQTRKILKSALDEMWQAELHLRQGHPDEALPYEHRALEFIKQVQQSTRIYLARVGLELPTPDETRRLSGERKDLLDRVGTLAATDTGDATITRLWRALGEHQAPDWDAAQSWIAAHQANLPDALGVLASIDNVRRDPGCPECRAQLRNLLWSLVPAPAANTAPRAAPDAAGRAYLDALQAEAAQGGAR